MFTGLTLLGLLFLAACVYVAYLIDNAQEIPAHHPEAVTGLDTLEAHGLIRYAYRNHPDPAAAEYAVRHLGDAA